MNALSLLLLLVPAASAQEELARACLAPEVTLRLEPYKGEDAAEREARRAALGESPDAAKADAILAGRAEVSRAEDGSDVLAWKRGRGSKGVSDCVRRLARLSERFPGRLSVRRPESRWAEAGERALSAAPEAVRKAPGDAAVQARYFDAGAARAGSADAVAVPAPLAEAALAPFRGGGTHSRTAGMTIDTDGDLRGADPALAALARRDPHRQAQTSLTYRNGRSLDPTQVPYVVIPLGDRSAKLGDYVVVEYDGRSALAIVGDRGPRHRFGEGSMALARALGMNPSGTTGGVARGVKYTFLGYGVGRPKSAEDLRAALSERSAALLR